MIAAPLARAAIKANAPASACYRRFGRCLAVDDQWSAGAGHAGSLMAAAAGVWMHGDAANTFGPGLISRGLARALPSVLRHLYSVSKEQRVTGGSRDEPCPWIWSAGDVVAALLSRLSAQRRGRRSLIVQLA